MVLTVSSSVLVKPILTVLSNGVLYNKGEKGIWRGEKMIIQNGRGEEEKK